MKLILLTLTVFCGLVPRPGVADEAKQTSDDSDAKFVEAEVLANQAQAALVKRDFANARKLSEEAIALHKEAAGDADIKAGQIYLILACAYDGLGKHVTAEPIFRQAIAALEREKDRERASLINAIALLAANQAEQYKFAESEKLYRRAIELESQAATPNTHSQAMLLENLGWLYSTQERFAQAEPLFRQAIGLRESAVNPDKLTIAKDLQVLAQSYSHQGKFSAAEETARRALQIHEISLGKNHLLTAESLVALATVFMEQKKFSDAVPLIRRALPIKEQFLGEDERVGITMCQLARAEKELGNLASSRKLYERALGLWKSRGDQDVLVTTVLSKLAELSEIEGKTEEAEAFRRRSAGIRATE